MTYKEVLEARNARMKAAINSGRFSDAEVSYLRRAIKSNDKILSYYNRIAKIPTVVCP